MFSLFLFVHGCQILEALCVLATTSSCMKSQSSQYPSPPTYVPTSCVSLDHATLDSHIFITPAPFLFGRRVKCVRRQHQRLLRWIEDWRFQNYGRAFVEPSRVHAHFAGILPAPNSNFFWKMYWLEEWRLKNCVPEF